MLIPAPALASIPIAPPVRRESRFTGRIFITRMAAIPFFALLLVTEDKWDGSAHPYVSIGLMIAGFLLVGAALLGRLWCTLYIGGRKTETLVTDGPYSLCRNPLYFFSAVGLTGVAAATGMITIVTGTLAVFALYYPHVIAGEERRLAERHGAAFAAYAARTPRFFPSWRAFRDNESVEFRPKFLYRAIGDATGFAAAWLLMTAISLGHDTGLIPTLLHLY